MAILKKGQRLKALIEQTGYSITTVAERIGYTREHLIRRLKGDQVDELLVFKIGNAIGVDILPDFYPEAVVAGHERDVGQDGESCTDKIARLESELSEAKQTIRDLSATLRALTEKK